MRDERDSHDAPDPLWDGAGEPDPLLARLEAQLRPLRGEPRPLDLRRVRRFRPRRPRWVRAVTALAAAALLVIATTLILDRVNPRAWVVMRLAGEPLVGGAPLFTTGLLRVGGWLETDSASRAKVIVGSIGQVDLEPGTRVKLLKTGEHEKRIELERGTIRALISAPPRLFQVATRGAIAVDLGCAYTLSVDESGRGLLRVEFGWVSLEDEKGRESYVPAGAACRVSPEGAGTPFFQDSGPEFQAALQAVDTETGPRREEALSRLLLAARPADALTLLSLLSGAEGEERARLYEGLARLAPPPEGVTREAVLSGERRAIERWWRALGLGEIKWWQVWREPVGPR